MSFDMTISAQGHDPGQGVGIGSLAQGRLVVRFEPSGPAAMGAPETIAPERLTAYPRPPAPVERLVKPRAAPGCHQVARQELIGRHTDGLE